MKSITVEASLENLDMVTDFVNSVLAQADCPERTMYQIDVAVDEIFSNIMSYAYNPEIGDATIQVEVDPDQAEVVLTFMDGGVPYDPLKKEDPDITLSADEREIGGLGIFIVKKTMDELSYEYSNGRNILRVKKKMAVQDK